MSSESCSETIPKYILRGRDEPLKKSKLTLEERHRQCLSVGEECIQEAELLELLKRKEHPICYDGFEPSGRMHIAQCILKTINVNKLTECGCIFVFYVADWFALLNNKMGGDLEKIKIVGEYFVHIWKAAGMDMTNVRFVWASDFINGEDSNAYWLRVFDISRKFNITRIKRCCQIMGRQESDEQPCASVFYPCMQCADIFHLKADICQLGMDQRKVNMLAREYCDVAGIKQKPVILSHKMLPGLLEGQEKMSKSDTSSAIFVEDTPEAVVKKIKKAFCPPGVIEGNPCIEYINALVFPKFGHFHVSRKEEYGGDITFATKEDLHQAYLSGDLHPGDLKKGLSDALNLMLQPIRDHFNTDPRAKELLQLVQSFKVTK
ncbi:tyrosyl-tRNA synthetase (tyrosyl-tRNA ligase) and class-I aaRS [Cryptosporidium canis]|uniref:tyrosine--tRNA ligase n=1 Tax=Cryptosporidium canis TaxID=195482 RepID=A0A9D5DJ18_9CRYT|nr:tyrosyl-tRNA synthetase (tyrosyl-tRNA ligase) and class-I aaRS [Cryptosporidium canis]